MTAKNDRCGRGQVDWVAMCESFRKSLLGDPAVDLPAILHEPSVGYSTFIDRNRIRVWHGDDLLILAGPTMNITGLQSIYRFHDAADLADDSISELDGVRLELLYHLPLVTEGDKAEGICLYDSLGEPGLLVVYDAPRPGRLVAKDAVLGDVFALPQA